MNQELSMSSNSLVVEEASETYFLNLRKQTSFLILKRMISV